MATNEKDEKQMEAPLQTLWWRAEGVERDRQEFEVVDVSKEQIKAALEANRERLEKFSAATAARSRNRR